ncbi:hypothetical protein [Microbacterium sp. UFMG61]|uniref:hypothetical protein n=1 Tax=Microbacterium sp. UFMG61 TaxID=2745935 RepID=UPI00188DEC83|nr:hypothetical protein [Microbacterium sp. UFMG61]
MTDTLGMLLMITLLIVAAIAIVITIVTVYARVPLEKKYESAGGGLGGSFEAVWMPSAHDAGMERDRQTKRTAPAPAPGDPPSTIDGDRIVLDI